MGQKKSQGQFEKCRDEGKQRKKTPKLEGHRKRSAKGEIYSHKCLHYKM